MIVYLQTSVVVDEDRRIASFARFLLCRCVKKLYSMLRWTQAAIQRRKRRKKGRAGGGGGGGGGGGLRSRKGIESFLWSGLGRSGLAPRRERQRAKELSSMSKGQ